MPESLPHNASLKLVLLSSLAAIGGFLFGYDTGIISSANLYLRDQFGFTDWQQELVVSGTVGSAAIFSAVGGKANRRLGPKRAILISSLIFILGSALLALSFSFWELFLGRVIVGIAIGLSSTTIPLYLAETSPACYRGRTITAFQLMITFGMWMASVLGAAFTYLNEADSWRWMLGFAALPATLQFVGLLFMPESPRWLVEKGEEVKAFEALVSINNGTTSGIPDRQAYCAAAAELTGILRNKNAENVRLRVCPTARMTNEITYFRKALLLGCLLQAFQQFSGINTVMYYSGTIIQMSGISSNKTAIWISSITSGVNFLCTFIGIGLVDRAGRRIMLLGSILGVIVALSVLSLSFFFISLNSIASTHQSDYHPAFNENNYQSDQCINISNCDSCLRSYSCGFCMRKDNASSFAACAAPSPNKTNYAQHGPCSTENGDHFTFFNKFCPTNLYWLPVVALVFYLCCFSAGFGPMPWTICA